MGRGEQQQRDRKQLVNDIYIKGCTTIPFNLERFAKNSQHADATPQAIHQVHMHWTNISLSDHHRQQKDAEAVPQIQHEYQLCNFLLDKIWQHCPGVMPLHMLTFYSARQTLLCNTQSFDAFYPAPLSMYHTKSSDVSLSLTLQT